MASRTVFNKNSPEGLFDANQRYEHQTNWSAELRRYVYEKTPGDKLRILEVGCGTGAVLRRVEQEIPERIGLLCGIDLSFQALKFAYGKSVENLTAADGTALPFADNCFDLVFCHYLLLWAAEPVSILLEMRRVLRNGGLCAALAEPCYGEMSASPDDLFELAVLQREVLIRQGIDPEMGKKLGILFGSAGFKGAEHGRYRKAAFSPEGLETEVHRILSDVGMKKYTMNPKVRYDYAVPTYFAIVRK